MEALTAIACIIGLVWWAFKSGKHEGSVKGYNVGRRHERSKRGRRRSRR